MVAKLKYYKISFSFFTLFILDTGKQVLLQTVKTQMKCRIRRHFIRVSSVCLRLKQTSGIEICNFIEISTCDPIKIQNGQFHTYCINMIGIIHQNETKTQFEKHYLCQSSNI